MYLSFVMKNRNHITNKMTAPQGVALATPMLSYGKFAGVFEQDGCRT